MLKNHKVGFIGAGNMTQALISSLISSKTLDSHQIWATNRSPGKLKKLVEQTGIQFFENNEELVDECDVVIIAVKPQDIRAAIEPISSSFHPQHVVISLAAGLPIRTLQKMIPDVNQIIRVMPNTPAVLQKGVLGYCLSESAIKSEGLVQELLKPLGSVIPVEEGDEFEALTVSCSSGIGFIFELMIYWQEWIEEHGFPPEVAREMTIKTFLGASMLAEHSGQQSLVDLQEKVVSKKGVTAAGLESLRELEVDRALRISFEKAVMRDRELAQN